ncbi:MAG: ABC transporter substrate-binding protein, partial [Flavobacteriaceae bacterium]|nr:ABC transporter substrate-binding protein [Flavobacteriaceae bacterium]
VLLILFFFISCNQSKYEKIQRPEGELSIVSLAPSITRELVDLGLKNNIVGATSYCDVSLNNKELIVGSAISVNIEKILLLKPDVVFASGLTKDKTIKTLENNGVTVYKFGKMKSFEDICYHFLELGKYVDKESKAKSIIKNSKTKIDSLISTVPEQSENQNIFFQVGAKPIFSVIPNTFMDDYISFSKCKNIASDLTKGTINRETIINRNPDVIFIISMGIMGEKEKVIWNEYPELNAAKNNKIFIVDAYLAATPTVLSFTKTLEIVINHIYDN